MLDSCLACCLGYVSSLGLLQKDSFDSLWWDLELMGGFIPLPTYTSLLFPTGESGICCLEKDYLNTSSGSLISHSLSSSFCFLVKFRSGFSIGGDLLRLKEGVSLFRVSLSMNSLLLRCDTVGEGSLDSLTAGGSFLKPNFLCLGYEKLGTYSVSKASASSESSHSYNRTSTYLIHSTCNRLLLKSITQRSPQSASCTPSR